VFHDFSKRQRHFLFLPTHATTAGVSTAPLAFSVCHDLLQRGCKKGSPKTPWQEGEAYRRTLGSSRRLPNPSLLTTAVPYQADSSYRWRCGPVRLTPYLTCLAFFFQPEQYFSLTTIQPVFSASFKPANGACVSSVFRHFTLMFQVFHLDVAKVDLRRCTCCNDIYVCCKPMF